MMFGGRVDWGRTFPFYLTTGVDGAGVKRDYRRAEVQCQARMFAHSGACGPGAGRGWRARSGPRG